MKVERNQQDGTGRESTYTHILRKGCNNLMKYKIGRYVFIILIAILITICNTASVTSTKNYAQRMTDLVSNFIFKLYHKLFYSFVIYI